jgi:hypothetical protein
VLERAYESFSDPLGVVQGPKPAFTCISVTSRRRPVVMGFAGLCRVTGVARTCEANRRWL